MRVLIFGSRTWTDSTVMECYLAGLEDWAPPDEKIMIIHGDARGADRLAGAIADQCGYSVLAFPAEWPVRGSPRWAFAQAGHERNQRMLDEGKPEIAVGFKDYFDWSLSQGGSEDMAKRCKAANVPTYIVSRLR